MTRQPLQPPDHELHHVVGVVFGADAIDVPSPDGRIGGRTQSNYLRPPTRSELNVVEERIAAGPLVDEFRQRSRAIRRAMQGIGDEPADIVEAKRCQRNLVRSCIGLQDRLECACERM